MHLGVPPGPTGRHPSCCTGTWRSTTQPLQGGKWFSTSSFSPSVYPEETASALALTGLYSQQGEREGWPQAQGSRQTGCLGLSDILFLFSYIYSDFLLRGHYTAFPVSCNDDIKFPFKTNSRESI